ncbi:MAG: hypothetical protein FWE94_04830 [Coriobacteriia bacterium]|nr:hypothetical protein [Coriobacteriia bacterium]
MTACKPVFKPYPALEEIERKALDFDLTELERKACLLQAKELVYQDWLKDKNDLDSLLRVATECWFIVSYSSEFLRHDFDHLDDLIGECFPALTEAAGYGLEHFSGSDTWLWVFGNLLSGSDIATSAFSAMVRAYLERFPDCDIDAAKREAVLRNPDHTFSALDGVAHDMFRRAHRINPGNLLARLHSLEEGSKGYLHACRAISGSVGEYFTVDSLIEEYLGGGLSYRIQHALCKGCSRYVEGCYKDCAAPWLS